MQLLVLLLLTHLGLSAGFGYNGCKVFKIFPQNNLHVEWLKTFEQNDHFDFWSPINCANQPVTVMVSPQMQSVFVEFLVKTSISFYTEIDDVESIIIQNEIIWERSKSAPKNVTFNYRYYRHFEINLYLEQLARIYPHRVRLETIGKSYEGRDINLVHISAGAKDKPTIFIDAGIHAREWIAPAMALYVINQLVENRTNHHLLKNVKWTILPVLNPDGYEYTWTKNRLWRKTRSPGEVCYGVDPNRNFDFHWSKGQGGRYNECNGNYGGKQPFSENCTQALRDYLLKAVTADKIVLYLTLHSFGKFILYPWGYDHKLPDNWQELDRLGHKVKDAIQAVRGTAYTVGNSADVLYPAAGGSDDWAMGKANISLVYTIELPGGGNYGFDLPPASIQDVCEETWQGFLIYHNYVAAKYGKH